MAYDEMNAAIRAISDRLDTLASINTDRGHHMKRGKTYAKAVKLVYDGGFCCKKREKRLTGIPIKASEPFHPFK
jgi:hypothetical protein